MGESNENVFVSPASLKVTLAMLHEGAGGKTAEEIRNALRLESPNFREQLQKILDNLGVCSYNIRTNKQADTNYCSRMKVVQPPLNQPMLYLQAIVWELKAITGRS